jgi:hypothetical protein
MRHRGDGGPRGGHIRFARWSAGRRSQQCCFLHRVWFQIPQVRFATTANATETAKTAIASMTSHSRSGVSEWCTSVVYLSGVSEWCIGVVYWSGVSDWCTTVVYRSALPQTLLLFLSTTYFGSCNARTGASASSSLVSIRRVHFRSGRQYQNACRSLCHTVLVSAQSLCM